MDRSKRIGKFVATACLVGSLAVSQPAIAQPSTDKLVAAVDAVVEAARAERTIPGVSVVITRGDQVLLAKGYGLADVEVGRPMAADTVFQIGSISKQFTAAAVMLLVEMRQCFLEDSIVDVLPGLSSDWHGVQIRHLLHQTSGVPEFLFDPKFAELDRNPSSSADELRTLIVRQPLRFVPGSRWSYSNSNYTLLAAVIERISGKPYDQFLNEQFFAPLGLRSIHHCAPQPTAADARGYVVRDRKVRRASAENLNLARGDGGLCASAEDLARWANALANGRVIAPASYRQMVTSLPVRDGYTPPYGFGLSLLELDPRHAKTSHHGAMSGFSGMLARYPSQDTVVTVLTNRGGLWVDSLEEAIARKVFELPDLQPHSVALSDAERSRYVGSYDTGAFTARVTLQTDGSLMLHTPRPGPTTSLLHQGAHFFRSSDDPGAINVSFECSEAACNRMRLRMAGMIWYGERIGASTPPKQAQIEPRLHAFGQISHHFADDRREFESVP